MGQTLFLECNSGISGDMTVGALLDLGADEAVLKRALDSMMLPGYHIEISRVKKAGLDVCDFLVKLDGEQENHDHDMEYLHGHEHTHSHEDGHNHGHIHGHSHGHSHSGTHQHGHRGLQEIKELIYGADITGTARATALRIFDILAQAEAQAHGLPVEEVHFHEVGAVDSIVDIVAVAVCLDNLHITEVIVPYLCEGQGTVRCQHGILPVPVPAVANIVQNHGLRIHMTGVHGELVTPTGAAIAAAIRSKEQLPECFRIQKIGMGAGKRSYERPSILRAMLLCPEDRGRIDSVIKLEANIDDCTGEVLGYVMDCLMEHGARDVHYVPVFMKKNRPAYQLTVICGEEEVEALENIIFRETTTIGIRRVKMERTVLPREMKKVHLSIGEMGVKECTLPDGTVRKYPEYETAAELAGSTGKALQEVLDIYRKEMTGNGGENGGK